MFQRLCAPRGVLDCRATDVDDPTEDRRFGRGGKQTMTESGPLTRQRMETIPDCHCGLRRRAGLASAAARRRAAEN
jgi:hypothetical protein